MTRPTAPRLPTRPAYPVQGRTPIAAADRLRGLLATLGILLLLVGLPAGLLFVRPFVFPNWLGMETLRIVVLGGDVSRVLLLLGYAAVWLVWAWLAGKVLVELARQAQRLHRPHLTPLPAGVAGKLVATAWLLFASLPLHSAVAAPASTVGIVDMPDDGPVPAPRADRPPDDTPDITPGRPAGHQPAAGRPSTGSTRTEERAPSEANTPPEPRLVPYVVRQRDSLWGLAESLLGDGRRYREIHGPNRGVLGPDPGFLPAGATILVPEAAPSSPARSDEKGAPATHTVQPGDTLSEIAQAHYGDPAKYEAIAQASKDTVQPGGQHLTDPDHIEPGWTLTLPGSPTTSAQTDFAAHQEGQPKDSAPTTDHPDPAASESAAPTAGVGSDTGADDRPDGGSRDVRPTEPSAQSPWVRPEQPAPPSDTDGHQNSRVGDEPTQDVSDEAPTWLLPGVAAGGAILAAGLHVAITRGRSRQARLRRPGRMTAPTPPDLIPAAATARFVGGDRVPDVQRLDLLLRALAGPLLASGEPRPKLAAVELTMDEAVLHLAEPTVLPEPWTGEGKRWAAPLSAAPDQSRDLVPYPMLVTVGVDDAGNPWLLDLEHLHTVAVVGEAADVTAFGRHLVAELAVNPWTVNLTTHAVGIADGAAALSRYRVEEHTDTRFVEPITANVHQTASETPEDEDHEWFHAVLTTVPGAAVADLATAIHAHPGRPGAVVVALGGQPGPADVVPVLYEGRLRIDAPPAGLDLNLVPALMSAAELDACARIVQITRDPADVPNPLTDAVADTEPAVHVVGRPDDPDTPVGPESILPAPDVDYTSRTANLREDLARLAPAVQPHNSDSHGGGADQPDPDPTLDDDLAAWWNQDSDRPRIEVLGSVSMWGIGDQAPNLTPALLKAIKMVTDRRPTFTVLMAFLALHPQGVTLEQVEQVTGLVGNDARSRITSLRGYLGVRTDGTARISLGKSGRPKADDPPHLYVLEDALVDADLFRRLYQRAIRQGADGLTDLVTALELVDGKPFTLPKDDPRWLWATDGEGLAARYTALIGDAAHLVITRAVLDGDLSLARRACETWRTCDPSSEALADDDRLVTLAEGHPDQAQQIASELWTRYDDEAGPTEPSERTQQILAAHHEAAQQASTRARPDDT